MAEYSANAKAQRRKSGGDWIATGVVAEVPKAPSEQGPPQDLFSVIYRATGKTSTQALINLFSRAAADLARRGDLGGP